MPFYQYYCKANELTVEVNHPMSKRLKTWGEVCDQAAIAQGDTSLESPVVRLISKPLMVSQRLKGMDKDEPSDRLLL